MISGGEGVLDLLQNPNYASSKTTMPFRFNTSPSSEKLESLVGKKLLKEV